MLPSVCDDHWHHYAIVYEHEQPVQLYVDGHEFTPSDTNPEVLYDKSLHAMKAGRVSLSTTIAVLSPSNVYD